VHDCKNSAIILHETAVLSTLILNILNYQTVQAENKFVKERRAIHVATRHKWMQYKFMKRYDDIKYYLPHTQKLNRSSFFDFTAKYKDIIVKPNDGRRGAGVYRITAADNKAYRVHKENKRIKIQGMEHTYDYLKEKIGSRKYIVQRRVPLATVDGRPMDVRIIVQRKKYSDTWKLTGNAVKVAGKGYIVTNITRSDGTILPVKKAIEKSSLNSHSYRTLLADIEKVAIRSAKRLSGLYPHHRIFGFDMGLDRDARVWIIEVNRFPMMSHFRKLKDKDMYERIKRYKKG
jgi:glutathione synthase/RimK-type ligase-like ATP-grasp enzyme